MINVKHLIKVSLSWINITYVICFVGVAIFPSLRSQFMVNALHTNIAVGGNVITVGTFVYGLIWWNIISFLGVGLFAVLFNKIKK